MYKNINVVVKDTGAVEMTVYVPKKWDTEEYIDMFLEKIMNPNVEYDWDFT